MPSRKQYVPDIILVAYIYSQCLYHESDLYKLKDKSDKIKQKSKEGKHKILLMTVKLLIFGTFWKMESQLSML